MAAPERSALGAAARTAATVETCAARAFHAFSFAQNAGRGNAAASDSNHADLVGHVRCFALFPCRRLPSAFLVFFESAPNAQASHFC
jgi:hypothetical protein